MSDPERIVLFSYFPLINKSGLQSNQLMSSELIGQIQDLLAEAQKLANAHACIWLLDGGKLVMMLVLSEARRVYDDLTIWAEGKPEEWFTVQFLEKYDSYAVTLFPNVSKSLNRYQLVHLIREEQFLGDHNCEVVMMPLYFTAQPGGNSAYSQIKGRIGDSLPVYLYDRDDIDTDNPNVSEQIDEDLIIKLGVFGVESTGSEYLSALLDSTTETNGQKKEDS